VRIIISELFRPVTVSPHGRSSLLLRISPPLDDQLFSRICQLAPDGICEPPTESSLQTELFRLIQRAVREQAPSSAVLPYITPGYSDNRFFRRRNIPSYGFFPLDEYTPVTTIHQANERISLSALEKSFAILFTLILRFAL
jgi:acetylornithine deacetylase/succinyl-diaminopimelate desuccinylase-like protein